MKLKKILSLALATITASLTLCLSACDLLGGNSSSSSSQQSEKVIDYKNITWSCLGDSITDESGGEKYPSMLMDAYGYKAMNNYAKSGATITTLNENNLQQQIGKVDKDSDIISILAGVNDFLFYSAPKGKKGFSGSTDNFYGAVDTLIKGLKERCPNAYIFFMTPYKCQWKDGRAYDKENKEGLILSDYVNVIIDLCKQYDLDYLNLYVDGGFDYTNPYYTTDGLHPLGRFYDEFTVPMVAEFIETNYPSFAKAKMTEKVVVDA